jgi:hypothetical protein
VVTILYIVNSCGLAKSEFLMYRCKQDDVYLHICTAVDKAYIRSVAVASADRNTYTIV